MGRSVHFFPCAFYINAVASSQQPVVGFNKGQQTEMAENRRGEPPADCQLPATGNRLPATNKMPLRLSACFPKKPFCMANSVFSGDISKEIKLKRPRKFSLFQCFILYHSPWKIASWLSSICCSPSIIIPIKPPMGEVLFSVSGIPLV